MQNAVCGMHSSGVAARSSATCGEDAMSFDGFSPSRRHLWHLAGLGAAAWCVPGVFAQALVETPRQTSQAHAHLRASRCFI